MAELLLEIGPTFHQVSSLGQKMGTRTQRGGHMGLLKLLNEHGPQTVPQLARDRSVTRQHVQIVVNELVELGLVEFIDNPSHRRSKLLQLTASGHDALADMTGRLQAWCEEKSRLVTASEIRVARRVLAQLRNAISL